MFLKHEKMSLQRLLFPQIFLYQKKNVKLFVAIHYSSSSAEQGMGLPNQRCQMQFDDVMDDMCCYCHCDYLWSHGIRPAHLVGTVFLRAAAWFGVALAANRDD